MRAVAATLAVLALAGCGGSNHAAPAPGSPAARTPTAAPAPPSDAARIQTLLRRPPTGPRLQALRVRDLQSQPDQVDVSGLTAKARVIVRYQIAGVTGTFQSVRRVALARRHGRWRVAAELGRRGLPPWQVADFAEVRTPHFVVLVPRGTSVGDLGAVLEAGYAAMRERLTSGRLRGRYLVIDAADPAQARALTTQIRGLDGLAAVADAAVDEEGPAQAVSRVVSLRVLVVASAFAGLDAEGRQRTIAHELTHAALAGSTSGRTPSWLVEGTAMYVSGDRRPAPADPHLGRLSRPGAIGRLSGEAQADAYRAASAAAYAIVERFGADKLLDLYDAFNDPSLRGEPGPQLVNRALHRELGIGLSDLP
ncbi:MAG TPA: hypothetical protein VH418_18885 [Solirubrobacteraceae bacterium]